MKKIKIVFLFICLIATSGYSQISELNFNLQRINFSAAPRTALSPMSIKLWDNYNNGGPTSYGTVLEIYGFSGHQTGQLYFGGWDNSKIRYREAFYNQTSWSDWITLLDSKNDVESAGLIKINGNGNNFISGNLSIGATTPSNVQGWNKVLDVHGSNHSKILATSDAGGVITGVFSHGIDWNGIVGRIGTESNHDLRLMAGYGRDQLTIKTNGNIGIGTTNPTKLLTIKADEYLGWEYTTPGSGSYHTITGGGINPMSFTVNPFSANDPIFKFNGNTGTKVTILNGGNVGIGTTNPTSLLTVAGKIDCREVNVTVNAGADFVFEENYPIKNLDEVEAYIKENKHLPEIAPASEMEANGIELGNMNIKLLQKVEELTLYLIDLNKRVNSLEIENKQLKAELKTLKE